jgi:hypothetical protein
VLWSAVLEGVWLGLCIITMGVSELVEISQREVVLSWLFQSSLALVIIYKMSRRRLLV